MTMTSQPSQEDFAHHIPGAGQRRHHRRSTITAVVHVGAD